MDTGFIELPEQLIVLPGDSFETEFVLWDRPGLDRIVVPGRQWRIQQGRQLVAIGTVLSVLD
jgi:elongation factor Tu